MRGRRELNRVNKYFFENDGDTQEITSCPHSKNCGGCDFIGTAYKEQISKKISDLQVHLKNHQIPFTEINFLSAGVKALRDRLDFTLIDKKIGLYSKESKEIVDISICQQLSPTLQEWLTEFRKIQWPFTKASFRLRVNQYGHKGLWIDAANTDIKILLDEKNILLNLIKICFVEIGQRRKIPYLINDLFKLKDPEHHIWFQTTCGELSVDLHCQIASFTQPSLQANKALGFLIEKWVGKIESPRILEFGSGIGNLSFPALSRAGSLTACEIDELALEGFRKSLSLLPQELADKVTIHRGDFQKKLTEDFKDYDLVLANPPRSGLQNFLNPLMTLNKEERPPYFIYMSCFPESFAIDAEKLKESEYQIEDIYIVDQFPQSKHYEVLALFKRN